MKIYSFVKDSIAMEENEKEAFESRIVENVNDEQESGSELITSAVNFEEETPKRGRKKKVEENL